MVFASNKIFLNISDTFRTTAQPALDKDCRGNPREQNPYRYEDNSLKPFAVKDFRVQSLKRLPIKALTGIYNKKPIPQPDLFVIHI